MPGSQQPPKLADRFLGLFLRGDFLEDVLGDLWESFDDNVSRLGLRRARWRYWYEVLRYLRPFALKKRKIRLNHALTMYTHFLKISWRNLRRHLGFSAIEIGGFAIGIAATLLIALYIQFQQSFDRHYEASDRIFRVVNRWSEEGGLGHWTNVHGPLKEVLEDNIPDMELVARAVIWPWGDAGENNFRPLEANYNDFQTGFMYADPELLEILEIPMIYGGRDALDQPNTIVISQSVAEQYYPGIDPVGRQVILNDRPTSTFTISGVMEDFASNHHLQADFVMTLVGRKSGPGTSGWCCSNYDLYTRLTPQADKVLVEQKTRELRNSLVVERMREVGATNLEAEQQYQSYYLQPVGNIYLNPEEVGDHLRHGSAELVWIFGIAAVLVLLLASVNFVNLGTARSMKRAQEVGVLKALGSHRRQLVAQYLVESVLYCTLAVALGTGLAWLMLPAFNQLGDLSLEMPWLSYGFLPSLMGGALILGLCAGAYPALYLSGFHAVDVLKGQGQRGSNAQWLRSVLVVFQFAATVVLIIAAMTLYRQFDYMMSKALGYEKEQVVNLSGLETLTPEKRLALKQGFLQHASVLEASLSDYLPVEGSAIENRSYWQEARRQLDNGMEAARWAVDEDYLATMKITMLQGRNFSRARNESQSIIINEQMVEALRLDEPLGQQLIDMFDQTYEVIGVMKDFHFESLFVDIRPLALVYGNGRSTISLKISADTDAALTDMQDTWDEFVPNQAMRYDFLDQRFARMYHQISTAKIIFVVFAALSIVVACLGLLALSVHMVAQRSKEMSIRKVLGASSRRIFMLLTSKFVRLVLLAVVIAIPIGWVFMDLLLEDMAHRIDLSWDLFLLAGVLALLVSLLTISYESVRAAMDNPANKLRSE
ncbi:MAG: FtsX-like permease family protein [Bacteroidota bacterium]